MFEINNFDFFVVSISVSSCHWLVSFDPFGTVQAQELLAFLMLPTLVFYTWKWLTLFTLAFTCIKISMNFYSWRGKFKSPLLISCFHQIWDLFFFFFIDETAHFMIILDVSQILAFYDDISHDFPLSLFLYWIGQ